MKKTLAQKEIQLGKYKLIVCGKCPKDKNIYIYNNDGEGGQFRIKSFEKKMAEFFKEEL